jgi:Rrf2 family protein
MRISTKGRYGLRAMVELAGLYGSGPILMQTIADRQDLSRKYLHALLTLLKDAGLVESVRGARGGYVLSRAPQEINANEVVAALEGRLQVVDCEGRSRRCRRYPSCCTRDVWNKLNTAISDVLSRITLADLAGGLPLPIEAGQPEITYHI